MPQEELQAAGIVVESFHGYAITEKYLSLKYVTGIILIKSKLFQNSNRLSILSII